MFYVKFDNSNIYNIECCAKYIKCKKKMSDNQELSVRLVYVTINTL